MKKTTLILLILSNLTTLLAQQWAPVGSKWTYSDISWGFPYTNSPRIIESVADTTILGKECRVIDENCGCGFFVTRTYMYAENNKIYLFNDSTQSFHTLYDFSVGTGGSWTIVPPNPTDSFKVVVESVYPQTIQGVTYNIQQIRNLNSGDTWIFTGKVAEGIGNISVCFFPQYAVCDPFSGRLRCYDDTENIAYFDTIPCDSTIYSLSVDNNYLENDVAIYPNPATSTLFIDQNNPQFSSYSIEIFSLFGQKVISIGETSNKKTEISMENLPKGMYVVQIIDETGNYSIKKIFKE